MIKTVHRKLKTVLKSCSFNNIWGHMIKYTIQQKFNEFFKIIYHVIKMVLNAKVKTTEPHYLFNKQDIKHGSSYKFHLKI